jgi:hypothetical protein
MHFEKKLVYIFKSFIEKALIPQVRRNDGTLSEWNKFCTILAHETLNYNQLQLYVDTLPMANMIPNFDRKENSSFAKEK